MATVDPSRAAFVQSEFRYSITSDTAVQATFVDAREVSMNTQLDEASAITLGAKYLAEFKVPKRIFEITFQGVLRLEDFASSPPRFTLTDRRQPTNLYANSNVFVGAYNPGGSVLTPNAGVAPDGTNTATRLTLSGGTNFSSSYSVPSGVSVVSSVHVKNIDQVGRVNIYAGNGNSAFGRQASFDFSLTSIVPGDGLSSAIPLADGWYRLVMPYRSSAYIPTGTLTLGAPGGYGKSFYLWGAQAEIGETVTPYVPTVAGSLGKITCKTIGATIDHKAGTTTVLVRAS